MALKLALQEAIALSVHANRCIGETAIEMQLVEKGCPRGRMAAWHKARADWVTRSGPGC